MAVFSLLVLPKLAGDSMFLDGVHFASVARNLAEGVGTFWAPHYTATIYPVEHDHPPLGFELQSLAFRLFGDSPSVERLYGCGVGLGILGLLSALWNRARRREADTPGSWCVLLLFSLPPAVSHAVANNLLEPMMTVFVLISAMLSCEALRAGSAWRGAMLGAAAGAAAIAAMLVKGPAGAFILVLPLCALATSAGVGRRAAVVTQVSIVAGMLLVAGSLLVSSDGARGFVADHVRTQIVPSLAGLREQQSRWHVIGALFAELGVPLLLLVSASVLLRIRPGLEDRGALFLLLGLAGSLPFLMSPKQPRRYLIPSFPFFVIAMTLVFRRVACRVEELVENTPALKRGLLALAVVILASTLTALAMGRGLPRKTDAFHTDFSHLATRLPPRALIQVCPASLMQEWGLHANFQRTFEASLTPAGPQPYYLRAVATACEPPPSCAELLNEDPRFYALYRCAGSP